MFLRLPEIDEETQSQPNLRGEFRVAMKLTAGASQDYFAVRDFQRDSPQTDYDRDPV
jgi:hypothetical protein